MNVPAIAKKTFDELKGQPEFMAIVESMINRLKELSNPFKRANLIHQTVDSYNVEVFNHPLVMQFSPCTRGCTACCHTQVSVTDDEALLLVNRIKGGVTINEDHLRKQMSPGNDGEKYFQLSYENRRCIFLDEHGACRVYEDRPSVCRTNAVIGEASQCDTSQGPRPTRLIKTAKSDMAIYGSFYFAKESGTLPFMVGKLLNLQPLD